MGQRREGVEHRDHHLFALEVDRVVNRETVDPDAGDGRVDQFDIDVRDAELEAHRMLRLPKGSLLDQLERLEELDLVDLEVGVRPRNRHRRAQALDLLPGDPDDRLAGDRVAHVLGLRHRPVAAIDDSLDVGGHAALHVGDLLPLARRAQDHAVPPLPLDHQRLDVLGTDIERRVVVLVIGAAAQSLDAVLDLDHDGSFKCCRT